MIGDFVQIQNAAFTQHDWGVVLVIVAIGIFLFVLYLAVSKGETNAE